MVKDKTKIISNVKTFDINEKEQKALLKSSQQKKDDFEYRNGELLEPPYDPYQLAGITDINVWHKRCLNIKASCISDLGWHIEGDNKAEKEQLEKWVRNCTEDEDFSSMLTKTMTDNETLGNSWFEIARNVVNNRPMKIYHGRAISTRIKSDVKGHAEGYIQKKNNKDYFFRKYQAENKYSAIDNEMLHFMQYSPLSDWYGIPEWLPALTAIYGDKNSMDYNLNFFDNNAIPPVMMIIKGGELDEQAEKALQSFMQENLKGVENAHRLVMLPLEDSDQDIDFHEFGNVLKDQAFGEFRKMNREEIAGIHGVPPRLLGIIAAGSLGGTGEIEGQLTIFKEILIKPKQRKLEYLLNELLVRRGLGFEHAYIKLDELDITLQRNDSTNFATLSTAYAQLVQAGIVDSNYAAIKLEIAKSAVPQRENLKQQILKIQKSINNAIYK